jgi:hypothetical protein
VLALLPQGEHAAPEAFYARTVGAAGGKGLSCHILLASQAQAPLCMNLERAALQKCHQQHCSSSRKNQISTPVALSVLKMR